MIDSVGPITARQIVSYCGGPKAVFKEQRSKLLKIPQIGPKTANEIQNKMVLYKAEKELEFIARNDIRALFYLDENYPGRLKAWNDSPVMIYCQGDASLNHPRTISVVGTRKASESGKLLCARIIQHLKAYNVQVISGLAFGIDASSHRAALNEGLETIAVMASGLQHTYPAAHRNLRKRIAEKGAIFTEFSSSTTPEKEHFPMRNRIIAGLSDALLVVESARKGGSMITAQMAFAYNKDVFAIPGRPGEHRSEGPNYLIKKNVAALIENGDDLAEKMLWEKNSSKRTNQLSLFKDLTKEEFKIVELIRQRQKDGVHLNEIHYELRQTISNLNAVLLDMECKNIIRSLPGSRYTLT